MHVTATIAPTTDSEAHGVTPPDPYRSVRHWLWFMWGTVFAMVIIGGTTRLTGSGLSMVEWRPLMGVLPPLTEGEWLDVFAKYQQSPQYQQVNSWMTLADFKTIFFWEYLHRLFGRLIGLFFLIPFVFFAVRRKLTGPIARRVGVAFILGGLQGLLGWYMVKSGLVDRPEVSHFRLAAHLSLAFFVGMYLVWAAWDLAPRDTVSSQARPVGRWTWAWTGLLGVQIVWGAFMAGKRAGHLSPTFPDMNGEFIPAAAFAGDSAWWSDLVENPWAIHWLHRSLAWLVLLGGFALVWHMWRRAPGNGPIRNTAKALVAMLVLQFALGIVTVVAHVPVWAGVMHQAGAYLLLTVAVRAIWLSRARVRLGA